MPDTEEIVWLDMALDGFKVLQYDCVEHPKPEITESQMNNHILAVIAICPYMPTSFRDFVRYVFLSVCAFVSIYLSYTNVSQGTLPCVDVPLTHVPCH